MASLGLASPSITNLRINFRTAQNEPNILQKLYNKPSILKISSNTIVEHKFFFEKGAPFILLNTNLCERPLKMLIDTGAAVSIVASDAIKQDIHKTNYFFSLFGIAGKDVSVTTEGMVHGIFDFNDTFLGSTLHLVDRKYTSTGDGYLGFDFLAPYKVMIDLNKMCLRINLNELIENNSGGKVENIEEKILKEENHDDFLSILAKNYDFELAQTNPSSNKKEKTHKKDYKEYYDAVKSFKNQLKEYDRYTMLSNQILRSLNSNNFSSFPTRHEIIYNDLKLNKCAESEKNFIKDNCMKYPLQFYVDGDPIGATHVLEHHIHLLPNAKIVNLKQYRVPQAHKKPMEEIIEEYEKNGIIEKCQSPYNSPAFLIGKKDDTGEKNDFRLVIDYKKLNQECEILNFPIPLIDDIINSLCGSKYFTTMDMRGAFHQFLSMKSLEITQPSLQITFSIDGFECLSAWQVDHYPGNVQLILFLDHT